MEILTEGYLLYIIIFLAAAVSYIISTLSGGGGSLLLVPIVSFLIGTKGTAPVINLGNLIGEPIRLAMFWKYIDWKVTKYYVIPAIAGTLLSAWLFSNIELKWLQIIVGLFLISTIFQYKFGSKEKSFKMELKWFMPLGFVIGFFSTLIGAVGPVLNPFYLNYGIEKEPMIATKTANSFLVGLVQISSYTALGSLKGKLWIYGIVLGLGASMGNWIGKLYLKKITNTFFRKLVIAVMVISGIVLIVKSLN
ncbi:putative membrane protein YfcA [Pedobacter sp. CG_S7]|uniref:sulfite exporter TauE/SafE family protein n=1 Tax=Pedobacter sp. CG_S7 TaxID=3143930 RepID=UPI00339B0B7B